MEELNKSYKRPQEGGAPAHAAETSRTHGWPVEEHKGVTNGRAPEGAEPNDQK